MSWVDFIVRINPCYVLSDQNAITRIELWVWQIDFQQENRRNGIFVNSLSLRHCDAIKDTFSALNVCLIWNYMLFQLRILSWAPILSTEIIQRNSFTLIHQNTKILFGNKKKLESNSCQYLFPSVEK